MQRFHAPLFGLALVSWAFFAQAAVPAEYTGTPYGGTPQEIPGRVELADLDEGGVNVAFWADHRRENAVAEGYSPISGDDYRAGDLDLPNICKTNRALEVPGEGSEDFWEDGTIYPSPTDLYWYYMGYAHTVDWVRVTVNVLQAGTYNVSSNWACANNPCGLSIWFNDGNSPADNPDRPLDGENKTGTVMLDATNDYHIWRAYPNFAQVELTAGEQLMTFHLEIADHLQYGFLQFDLVGGNTGGSGGTGGAATAGTGGTAAAAGGTPGTGGMTMAPSAGTGGAPGAGGVTTVNPGTSGQSTGGSAPGAVSTANTESSCALSAARGTSRTSLLLGLLLAVSLLLRRRK
jgi:hypothetical protein